MDHRHAIDRDAVRIRVDAVELDGDLALPTGCRGLVIFAHGSGSSRHSPRNRFVAGTLNEAGLATLLFDLLTAEEEREEAVTRHLRFDIPMLAGRLTGVVDWAHRASSTAALRIGLFGASTGAAAALATAAARPELVHAVVSRGGRPDLAGPALASVRAATLLIVGGRDAPVIEMNEAATRALRAEHRVEIVEGASHLFEEPGTLENVAALARDWFVNHF